MGPSNSLRNVLLIEDNPSDAEVMKFIVERMGCTVRHCANPFDGLDAVTRQPFDLILLDWQLPQLSGIDFLKRLQRIPGLEKMKVILVSGRNELKHVKTAIEAGAVDYIIKPVDPLIARAKIQRVLDQGTEWVQTPVAADPRWEGAEAALPVRILSLSEVGIDLQGSFLEGQVIELRSRALSEIGLEKATLRIVGSSGPEDDRTYQAAFIGLREGDLQKIRVYLKDLSRRAMASQGRYAV